MKTKLLMALPLVLALSACETYTTARYSINADTNVALKKIGAANIGVGLHLEKIVRSQAQSLYTPPIGFARELNLLNIVSAKAVLLSAVLNLYAYGNYPDP
jgi:hypothetical protein